MKKEFYDSPELLVVLIMDDVIRTSSQFTPGEAPDVYEPDPFVED